VAWVAHHPRPSGCPPKEGPVPGVQICQSQGEASGSGSSGEGGSEGGAAEGRAVVEVWSISWEQDKKSSRSQSSRMEPAAIYKRLVRFLLFGNKRDRLHGIDGGDKSLQNVPSANGACRHLQASAEIPFYGNGRGIDCVG